MTAYDPRESESRFQPDGTNKNPWDPYPMYVLEDSIYGTDGKIRPELVPDAAFETGVSTDVQAAIDLAKDEANANAANAQATADEALDAANTGVAGVQATADAAAADADSAQAVANSAYSKAQQALDVGTGAVGDAVETYLGTVPGLVDEEGRIAQWRAPAPEGFLDTDLTHNMGSRGGTYIFRLDAAATSLSANLPVPSGATPYSTWTIKNAGVYAFGVTISGGTGTFDNGASAFSVQPGEVYRLTTDGLSTYFILDKYAGAVPTQNVPDAVSNLVVVPTDTTLALSWTAPSAYPSVSDYRIETSLDSITWTTVADGVSTTAGYTVTGLDPETNYSVRVTPINSLGDGPSTEGGATTLAPFGPPPAPTGVVAETDTNYGQAVHIYWNSSIDANPEVSDWEVQYSLAGANTWTTFTDAVSPTPVEMDVTGLASATSYDLQVRAVNSEGAGAWSATVTATSSV